VADNCNQKWTSSIVGGELYPPLQNITFSNNYVVGLYTQNFTLCVETTKASYMLNSYAFSGNGYTGTSLTNAKANARLMGYAFVLEQVDIQTNLLINVTVSNQGVAPFYYPINPYLKIVPGGTEWDLTNISWKGTNGLPGKQLQFSYQLNQSAFKNVSHNSFVNLVIGLKSSHTFSTNPVIFCNQNASTNDGTVTILNAFYVGSNGLATASNDNNSPHSASSWTTPLCIHLFLALILILMGL